MNVVSAAGPSVIAVAAIGSAVWQQKRSCKHQRELAILRTCASCSTAADLWGRRRLYQLEVGDERRRDGPSGCRRLRGRRPRLAVRSCRNGVSPARCSGTPAPAGRRHRTARTERSLGCAFRRSSTRRCTVTHDAIPTSFASPRPASPSPRPASPSRVLLRLLDTWGRVLGG